MAKLKLNDDMIQRASQLIKEGNYAVVVCQYLGINESTYYGYVKQAEIDIEAGNDTIFTKFFKSIKEADAYAEMEAVKNIKASSQSSWQASAWYLERKHKDKWSVKQALELTGKDGNELNIKLSTDLKDWGK